jgi:hypothetical protein
MDAETQLRKEAAMHPVAHQLPSLTEEELQILTELLESERVKLLVEIRHTDHRSYREELRRREELVEQLAERIRLV